MMFAAAGGVVGGFAGGEAGLQQFIQEGEIKFKDPNEKGLLPLCDVCWKFLLV